MYLIKKADIRKMWSAISMRIEGAYILVEFNTENTQAKYFATNRQIRRAKELYYTSHQRQTNF